MLPNEAGSPKKMDRPVSWWTMRNVFFSFCRLSRAGTIPAWNNERHSRHCMYPPWSRNAIMLIYPVNPKQLKVIPWWWSLLLLSFHLFGHLVGEKKPQVLIKLGQAVSSPRARAAVCSADQKQQPRSKNNFAPCFHCCVCRLSAFVRLPARVLVGTCMHGQETSGSRS